MTAEPGALDAAQARMAGDEGDVAARLHFYARLAETELFVLLAREATGDRLEPQVFAPEAGPVVLAFDSEARLADFAGGGAFYAALSGRALAALLDGRELALGLNFGAGSGEALLPPAALSWLARAVGEAPRALAGRAPSQFLPPSVPEALVAALASGLAPAAGLAREALLADVRYRDGEGGPLIVFVGAREGTEPALARAVREALVFSDLDGGAIDVAFRAPDDAALPALARVALRMDLRLRPREEAKEPVPVPRLR